jgi:predicted transcriptional regulator
VVRASGSVTSAGAISSSVTFIVAICRVVVKIFSVYNQGMGKSIRVNGERLRRLRVEQALTLRALGELSGVSFDTINKLELGRRPAHASTIHKLADALKVEPRELMKGENNE